eukprot:2787543-Pleurochrysis_carterae.AAC.2
MDIEERQMKNSQAAHTTRGIRATERVGEDQNSGAQGRGGAWTIRSKKRAEMKTEAQSRHGRPRGGGRVLGSASKVCGT